MTDPSIRKFGLLLDVDGPIASPIERAIIQPSIIPDLVALLAAGVPVVFNTGRSDDFLRRQVVEPLQTVGIPGEARLYGVCEKGAVWFQIKQAGVGEIAIDKSLALPTEYSEQIRAMVEQKYSSAMFFDETKHAMVSVEQNIEVGSEVYKQAQESFNADALALMQSMDLGVELLDKQAPDSKGEVRFRIDPTTISTDIESVVLGKDRGAQRARELLAQDGELPNAWRTVGDSRTDYAMADWLHQQGHDVIHVDVRPGDGLLAKPYPVLTPARHSVNDHAGAAYINRVRRLVEGAALGEADFSL